MEHLFISYSRRDSEAVGNVVRILRDEGFDIWQDVSGKSSGIPYSTKWFAAIEQALYTSAGAIIFRSDAWEKSVPCTKEYEKIITLAVPHIDVDVNDLTRGRMEAELERIRTFITTEVYGSDTNSLRTWLLSSVDVMRTYKNTDAGIPHYRKRNEAKDFLNRLDQAAKLVEDRYFPAESADLYRDIERFLGKARKITIWDMVRRPLITCLLTGLVLGTLLILHIHGLRKQKSDANFKALSEIDRISNQLNDDELKAMYRMGSDLDFSDYIYVLFENYAEAMDTVLPSQFFPSGSKEAENILTIPLNTEAEGYEIELSETTGKVRIIYGHNEDYDQVLSLKTSSVPECSAVNGNYLSIASGRCVYVYDLLHGRRPVQLRYCYRDVESLRMDDAGHIYAITADHDVYVWDNPLIELCEKTAHEPDPSKMADSYISTDGRFELTGDAQGVLKIRDIEHDCIIWKSSLITEPVAGVYLDEEEGTAYALGISGSMYHTDAADILSSYSDNPAVQHENYKAEAQKLIDYYQEMEIVQDFEHDRYYRDLP